VRALIVGAGGIARDLVRRLGERWQITVVDVSAELLERMEMVRAVSVFHGDGSSRVVLVRAGLDSVDALIAAAADDDTNLEACRLAAAASISRIVAVCADSEREEEYRRLGVPVVISDSLSARRVEQQMESRRLRSVSFAEGKAEAMEFLVAEDSPVRGKTLAELHSHSWILGALLRKGELIIPHGETRLATGDRVTVVGSSTDFSDIVLTFTSGQGRFPLDFGKRVAVCVEKPEDVSGVLAEAMYIARNSKATSMVILHRDPGTVTDPEQSQEAAEVLVQAIKSADGVQVRPRPVKGRPTGKLHLLPREESVGLLVVPTPPGKGAIGWWRGGRALRLLHRTGKPLLLARGSHPYRRILVPARTTAGGRAAARAAIDMAVYTKAKLQALAVEDPVFMSGPDASTEARNAVTWLEDDAAVHDVQVDSEIVRGNPVREFLSRTDGCDLLVLALDSKAWRPWPRLVITGMLARLTEVSVLLVPVREPD
jgi:Trk K+ transport system NAD-binding subunit